MKLNPWILCALFVLGCSSSEPMNKADFEGATDVGYDACERFSWYSDGECDSFCEMPDPDCGPEEGPLTNIDGIGETVCVAMRGNGQKITAHFAGLARILELQGLISGAAGGSSASISAFLLDSVQLNPAVNCSDCSELKRGAHAALLFKSLRGIIDAVAQSDDVLAIRSAAALVAELQAGGIDAALQEGNADAVAELIAVLQSDTFKSLVNPEALVLLQTSPDPVYHANDLVNSLKNAANFDASDATILVRPGLLSFPGLAERIGRIGDFFTFTDMSDFVEACGEAGVGKTWQEISALPAGDSTCGELFSDHLSEHFADGQPSSRLDDKVGGDMHSLVITSVLENDAIDAWSDARADYLAAEPVTLSVNFEDVGYGYFGKQSDLDRVLDNNSGFQDDKTARVRSLGQVTWRDALSYSPAEPGLSRGLELPDGRISAGGWADLQPVLVLKNLGCDKVIYLTRRGAESGFAQGVAGLLGLQDEDRKALFDIAEPNSSFTKSLEQADGVWCTDWDSSSDTDFDVIFDDAYNAPFQTSDSTLTRNAYENTSEDLGIAGCTATVAD